MAPESDSQALEMRRAGDSFGAIARTLRLSRPTDAFEAFVRAAQRSEKEEELFEEEKVRLNALEDSLRADVNLQGSDLEWRLRAIDTMRRKLEVV